MYKQKLIDLLKSKEDVKEAMEEPIFGCKIYDNSCNLGGVIIRESEYGEPGIYRDDGVETYIKLHKEYISIIGLPLQERFLRMYCKGKYICFHGEKELNIGIYQIQLDNTKDFDNQSEETYMDIFNALIDIK